MPRFAVLGLALVASATLTVAQQPSTPRADLVRRAAPALGGADRIRAIRNGHMADVLVGYIASERLLMEGDMVTAAFDWQHWPDGFRDLLIMRTSTLLLAMAVAAGAASTAMGQAAPGAVPDLEGGWVRLDVAGSGSFQGLASRVPRAALTPAARKAADDVAARAAKPRFDFARDPSKPRAAGEGYVVTDGGCGLPGGVEPNSAAFHIVQSKAQVLIVRENPGLPRTIHLDGRVHPHLSRWTANGVGHSVGRYEGGALVVDTIGLATGNVTAGGWRTPETVLTERYRLSADGQRLTISYTWQDPKVYLKPHTYEIVAERTPSSSWAFEGWCDSSDPNQRLSIVPPAQK